MEKFIEVVRNLNPESLFLSIIFGGILTGIVCAVSILIYLLGIWLLLPLTVFIGATTMVYLIVSGDFVPKKRMR